MDLYRLNKKKPIFTGFILLFFCILLRIMDIFVLRLNERIGEIIVSKILGFLLILLFLKYTHSRIRDIGLNIRKLSACLPWGLALVLFALLLTYGTQYLFLLMNNASPLFIWNDYTWLQFILFVLIGNVVNSLMEEGLFRGILFRGFMQRWSFFAANSLQAVLFGLWHILWPIKLYSNGQLSLKDAVMNAFIYTIFSGIMGFLMGYIYYSTSNLWISIVWHTIWNFCMNVITIQSLTYTNDSYIMSMGTNSFWIAFSTAVILSIMLLHKRKAYKNQLYANY